MKILFILILAAISAQSATWYVDSDATGANNGTNWSNAWTNFYNVTNVVQGDTIEVSGGTYLQDTNLGQWSTPWGIAGSPVTIKHSRTVGHNNQARITVPWMLRSFCNIDGAMTDGIESVITNTPQVIGVETNCGFFFDSYGNTNQPVIALVGFRLVDQPEPYVKQILYSNDIKWVVFCGLSGPYQTIKYIDTVMSQNLLHCGGLNVSYCKFTNTVQWAISTEMTNKALGQINIHHIDFSDNQGLSTCGLIGSTSGCDIHHNLLNRAPFVIGGENEALNGGPGWRIYNNIFYACGAATYQCYLDSGTNYDNCYFYGNLICMQPTNRPIITARAVGQSLPAILNGGSGYAVGDVIRVEGGTQCAGFGTNEQKTQFQVKTVSGGVITSIESDLFYGGWYITAPSPPYTYVNIIGSGTGVSLDLQYVQTAPSLTYFQISTETTDPIHCAPHAYVENWRFFNNSAICTIGSQYGVGTGPSGIWGFLNKSWMTGYCSGVSNLDLFIPPGGMLAYNNLTWSTNDIGFGCYPDYGSESNRVGSPCYGNLCGDGKYNGWTYDTNGLLFDYNIGGGVYYSSNNTLMRFAMSNFNTWSGYKSNKWTMPTLRNIYGFDFSPTTGANGGTNLSSFTNDMPGLLYDLNGVRRGSVNLDGSWSIGALEAGGGGSDSVTNGLILYYTFNDEWGNSNKIYDMSGFNHHAYQYGYVPGGPGSNCWPNRVINTNNLAFGYAAEFDKTRDFQLAYDTNDGYVKRQYAAITNIDDFVNMKAMSITLWGRYFQPNGPDITYEANCTFLDSGYNTNGTWILGRDHNNPSSYGTTFAIRNHAGNEWYSGQPHLDFPDNEDLYFSGATAWHHYGVVVNFTNSTMNIYFDGTNCGSMTITNESVTNITVRTDSQPYWIALGVQTHSGTAVLEEPGPTPPYNLPPISGDQYPNDAWFDGVMDEVRIYNRALTSNEVYSIFSGSGGEPPNPPPSTNSVKAYLKGSGILRGNFILQ